MVMMSKKGGCDCSRVRRTDKPAMQDVDVQVGPKYAHCLHFNRCTLIGVGESDRGEGLGNNGIVNEKTGLMFGDVGGWWQSACCVLIPKLAVDASSRGDSWDATDQPAS